MICVLVFLSFGHAWINGSNQLAKYCYYDCNNAKNSGWYDRVYRVPFNYTCPARFVET